MISDSSDSLREHDNTYETEDSYSSGWVESDLDYESMDEDEWVDDGEDVVNYHYRKKQAYRMRPPTPSQIPKWKDDEEDLDVSKLVVLPRPTFRHIGWKTQPETEVEEVVEDEKVEEVKEEEVEEVVEDVLPWKELEKPDLSVDPWSFLEKRQPAPEMPRQQGNRGGGHHHRHHEPDTGSGNRRGRNQPSSSSSSSRRTIDNSDTNKLCKYKNECRMNRNGNCSMVHSLVEWKPRICRFDEECNRKRSCGFYHHDVPIEAYLSQMIKKRDSIYHKNAALYSKYIVQ